MTNQWASKEVAEAHGYLKDLNKEAHHHRALNDFIQKKVGISIFDIGCGNARVLNSINNYKKYLGIDICTDTIAMARQHFGKDPRHAFTVMDIENEPLSIHISEYNLVYFDSTLTMMANPRALIEKLISFFDIIFFNRTPLYKKTEESSYKWGGMTEDSFYWRFGKEFFESVSENKPGNFKFDIPNNCIIYEK